MQKLRLTLHINSLTSLAKNRKIKFDHPSLDCPIELCLGEDIGKLDVVVWNTKDFDNVDLKEMDS